MNGDTASALAKAFALAPVRSLGPGAMIFDAAARSSTPAILTALETVLAAAPARSMTVPGGHRMSVAMSNCGALGWVSDRRGYRYAPCDPASGKPWPAMPEPLPELAAAAAAAAGFPDFHPDCCLINRYEPGARMGLHQDRDEEIFAAPIVSVSLGLRARFLWGGLRRAEKPRRVILEHGDVLVFGGASRLVFHGVEPLAEGEHPATGRLRINLTFRRAASRPDAVSGASPK